MRAHPRACGENFRLLWWVEQPLGSSPRMRGKRSSLHSNLVEDGLIPAHAGKTTKAQEIATQWPAHPRACGENEAPIDKRGRAVGSSPRMRGKRALTLETVYRCGLIPAHAGKTITKLKMLFERWAHPRACGENLSVNGNGVRCKGSSPRMRGKLSAARPATSNIGLIPAHAGKTRSLCCDRSAYWAHPRACGENSARGRRASIPRGSSPRMRGKPWRNGRKDRRRRLIPAHAGKTAYGLAHPKQSRAHPRACGENRPGLLTR